MIILWRSYYSVWDKPPCPTCHATGSVIFIRDLQYTPSLPPIGRGFWHCRNCEEKFQTPLESHFNICPSCQGKGFFKRPTAYGTCQTCQGRKWVRI